MDKVAINTEFIKLGQLLKFASIVGNGSDAKMLIADGIVKVNGVVVTERGKKIHPGDVVEVEGMGSVEVEAE
ncbi:RNA-binding S4 domain-containing protein [Anaerotignum sp. MSJ-24]|uniref:RNA-binding S4 domain-containing protein n=1 Tax=Anaerotignum sp. MSJ-24 TaxID=2841521 RepID=UPI001C10278E|nr:RNA-binding S4 domain-containing protein [Anaerotignum sp. MSJ-24]